MPFLHVATLPTVLLQYHASRNFRTQTPFSGNGETEEYSSTYLFVYSTHQLRIGAPVFRCQAQVYIPRSATTLHQMRLGPTITDIRPLQGHRYEQ